MFVLNLTELNRSDICEHFSCPERSVSPAVYILLYMCSAAVVLLTVCGNMLIIISVLHFKQLHTPTNILVLSLAVSDFLIGALVMPPVLISAIESCWIFDTGYCISFLMTTYVLSSLAIYNVALIAVDRYLALSNPFLYTNNISKRTMSIVVVFNWFGSLLYNILLCYFNGSFTSSIMCPGECFLLLNEVWSVVDLIITFIFPCSIIIILYSRVFLIAKKHATAIRELNNHTRPQTQKITSHSMKSERKAAKVLGIVVSVFIVCFLPYFIYSLLADVIGMQADAFMKVYIVLCLNSTINPIIYALFYPWFRRCVKLIITGVSEDDVIKRRHVLNSSQETITLQDHSGSSVKSQSPCRSVPNAQLLISAEGAAQPLTSAKSTAQPLISAEGVTQSLISAGSVAPPRSFPKFPCSLPMARPSFECPGPPGVGGFGASAAAPRRGG
ncbi:trace amine-associated receptor 13c-like [Silurus meridionalis]|uniref:trace amine-associated receptor 13c-like n=1 Tax=Silurus meridionalis TaxID=175797 RepID=UPI001EEB2D00|nr:trace amine-associated receptor 13c-like [Silurus meridionalis]